VQEWGLQTEPWTFAVGRDGKVVKRFEGAVSVHELERVVRDELVDGA
jgi:glutathione peroxidase-family protein